MKVDTDLLKILYVAFALPLNIAALIKSQDMRYFIGIIVIFGLISFWLWQWHRRLVYRAEFFHLASRIPRLTGEERKEAHKRLLELARPNVIPVHEIAAAFDEMNGRLLNAKRQEINEIAEKFRKNREIHEQKETDDAIEL